MSIKESVSINAPPEDIWPYIADPVLMSVWNPKIVADNRSADQPVTMGERFNVTYQMSGRATASSVEVLERDPNQSLKLQHTIPWKTKEQIVVESYRLEAKDGHTVVTQSIDLSKAVPWPFRILIWFISRFGTTQGTQGSAMEQLKHTVEQDCAP